VIGLTRAYIASITGHLGVVHVAAIGILVIEIIATLATELWQRLLQAIAGLPPANWELVGRWVASRRLGNPPYCFVARLC
jgi:hypothetical protein